MFLKGLGFCCWKRTSSSERQYPTVIEEMCHPFSLADLRKSTNNFDPNRVIERRGFGIEIYKALLQRNDASEYTVILKRFKAEGSEGYDLFKNEIELLCQLRHPNCVSLIGFCNHEDEKILVFEYFSNGSLYRHLQRGELSWKKRLEICIGAARGLHYLHTGAKRSIFHRNITSTTIFLDDHMEPKLASFSISVQGPRFSKPKPIKVDLVAGTFGYVAVEHCRDGTITDKCDVYSFGVVLLEVVCGRNYFTMPLDTELLDIEGKIAPECWQVFIHIAQRCVKYEADERPTMGEVEVELEHALSLQEEADITNTNGEYTLLSKTILKLYPEQGLEHALSLHQEEDITEDSDLEDMFPYLFGELESIQGV